MSQTDTLSPLNTYSPSPSPSPWPSLSTFSMDSTPLGTRYEWNHTAFLPRLWNSWSPSLCFPKPPSLDTSGGSGENGEGLPSQGRVHSPSLQVSTCSEQGGNAPLPTVSKEEGGPLKAHLSQEYSRDRLSTSKARERTTSESMPRPAGRASRPLSPTLL